MTPKDVKYMYVQKLLWLQSTASSSRTRGQPEGAACTALLAAGTAGSAGRSSFMIFSFDRASLRTSLTPTFPAFAPVFPFPLPKARSWNALKMEAKEAICQMQVKFFNIYKTQKVLFKSNTYTYVIYTYTDFFFSL